MSELIITVDDDGSYFLEGREVFVVDLETSKDQNSELWFCEEEHNGAVIDAVEAALEQQKDEITEAAEYELAELRMHFEQLLDLVGVDIIRQAARQEIRSLPIKAELSRRGIL